MNKEQIAELMGLCLRDREGGVQIYETALLRGWNEDQERVGGVPRADAEPRAHRRERVLAARARSRGGEPPGRLVVRHIGESLVKAMEMALEGGKPEAAQIVAAECVVLAETKDHLNWELIGELAKKAKGEKGSALKDAHKEVEEEEDEHLYHTTGWTRELWIEALGMPAVLPPPGGREGREDGDRRRPGQARGRRC